MCRCSVCVKVSGKSIHKETICRQNRQSCAGFCSTRRGRFKHPQFGTVMAMLDTPIPFTLADRGGAASSPGPAPPADLARMAQCALEGA